VDSRQKRAGMTPGNRRIGHSRAGGNPEKKELVKENRTVKERANDAGGLNFCCACSPRSGDALLLQEDLYAETLVKILQVERFHIDRHGLVVFPILQHPILGLRVDLRFLPLPSQ